MPLYLTVSEGPTPSAARPIVAVGDEKIVKAVLKQVTERLGRRLPAESRVLALRKGRGA